MSDLPVPPDEIYQKYLETADDVSSREGNLRGELPIDATADIHTGLREAVDDWRTGRKSIRALPACNVYNQELDISLSESVVEFLVSLDVQVNVFDDIIDTQDLSVESKIGLTVNAAFSAVQAIESCPREKQEEVGNLLRDYFTALFQIPLVERKLFKEVESVESRKECLDLTRRIYEYRARDIDAFAQIPATILEVRSQRKDRILQDLRTYRAKRLLFKDIRDIERDLEDDDITPIIHFLRRHESIERTVETIEDLYGRFEYTDKGFRRYGDILQALEDQPEDLCSYLLEKSELDF